MQKNFLFFLPNMDTRPYLNTLVIAAEAVRKYGHNVYFVSCGGCFSRCISLIAYGPIHSLSPIQRDSLCKQCVKNSLLLEKETKFQCIKLSSFIDDDIKEYEKEIFLSDVKELQNFCYKDIALGQYANNDYQICTKQITINKKWGSVYKEILRDMLIVTNGINTIIDKYEITDIITYNPYSSSQVIQVLAKNKKKNYFSLANIHNAGADWSTLVVDSSTFFYSELLHIAAWKKYNNYKLHKTEISDCYNDVFFRLYDNGSHVFSPKKSIDQIQVLDKLNIDFTKKVIVAFTSSLDEMIGLESSMRLSGEMNPAKHIFKTQIDWLQAVKKYAEVHDYQFLIRIHPREGRDGGSEHLNMLRSVFTKNSSHMRVIWPESPLSSYDILEFADIVLFSTSTMGIEAARLGIPSVSYSTGWLYNDAGLIETAKDENEYWNKIESALNNKKTIFSLKDSVRFYAWRFFRTSLHLGPEISHDPVNKFLRASSQNEKNIMSIFEGKETSKGIAIKEFLAIQPPLREEDEYEELRFQIRRIVDAFFFGTARADFIQCKDVLRSCKRILFGREVGKNLLHIMRFIKLLLIKVWRITDKKQRFIFFCAVRRLVRYLKDRSFTHEDYSLEFYIGKGHLEHCQKRTKNCNVTCVLACEEQCYLVRKGLVFKRVSPLLNRLTAQCVADMKITEE